MNVRFPNWLVAEIKLYTKLMFDAQDTPRVLPIDTKIPLAATSEVYEYGNLWTEKEMQYIQGLKDAWKVQYIVSNDVSLPIDNHIFYEIDRVLMATDTDVKDVDIALLKNKLIAIQKANSLYSRQLYEKEHWRPYIPK